MTHLGETFSTDELPQSSGYDTLPAGWYNAKITEAKLKDTNDRTGQLIAVRYDIIGPTHQGRVVFGNINIRNKSDKAQEIGRQQLGDIMRSIGVPKLENTDQLIGGTLQIKVSVQPERTDEKTGQVYDARNEVKGFKAIEGSAPPMPSGGGSAPAAAKKPWER